MPLRWLVVVALLIAIPLIVTSRYKAVAYVVGGAFALHAGLPLAVQALYVSPNELTLESEYIERHIQATRQAYAINSGKEQFLSLSETPALDVEAHSTLIDNIRLWDEQAYTDTITQIQALRLYYRFADMDIDRYQIDGKVKQLLLSPARSTSTPCPPRPALGLTATGSTRTDTASSLRKSIARRRKACPCC